MATYKHIRSNVDSKRPTTSLADGQIAINTNVASPGVFFKDSAGTGIVKVGPVHVGTTAPNATPGAGGSTGNSKGEQWLDTSLTPAQLKVWNGSAWIGVVADELPVSKLQNGSAYQLLQTDAAGTGVEWASNIDVPGSLNVTSTAVFDSTVSHPLGSAAAPTITFTGDANTGIYSPGIDQVAITTGGTGRLYINSSGRVGVGTSSPSQALTLRGEQFIETNSTSADSGNGIYWQSTTSGWATSGAHAAIYGKRVDGSNGYLRFDTRSSGTTAERLRIESSGRVGIGTSNPDKLLHIEGDSAEFKGTNTNPISGTAGTEQVFKFDIEGQKNSVFGPAGSIIFRQDGSTWSAADQYFKPTRLEFCTQDASSTDNSETPRLTIDQVGNVGIGTTSFTATASGRTVLEVNGTSGALLNLDVGGTRKAYYYTDGTDVYNFNTANGDYIFGTNDSESMRISSSGNVFIGGTTAASADIALNADGSATFAGTINNITVGRGAGNVSTNTAVGSGTLQANTTGNNNVANGYRALYFNTTGNQNTAIGRQALYSNTEGSYNVANGSQALYFNTTGVSDVAIGFQALYFNTGGNNNTANGRQALYSNTTGNNNVANGYQTLRSNTTGNNNVANGYQALRSNTTGINNTATGLEALYFNTTGNNNVANGYQAVYSNTTGESNAAIGLQALFSNTEGDNNTANGFRALYSNTTGNNNTASGREALYSNITGGSNVANGYQALYFNTTGNFNTASGVGTLYSNTEGTSNTANGYQALRSNTEGDNNTANGHQALYLNTTGVANVANGLQALRSNTTGNNNTATGLQALYSNTTGNDNTANGFRTLHSNTTGSSNTASGRDAGRYKQNGTNATNFSNCAYLGFNTRASGSNQVQLGDSNTTTYAYGSVQNRSDARDKTDVRDTLLGLDFIKSLRPVDFRWDMRDDYFDKEEYQEDETRTRQVENPAYVEDGEEPEYIEEEYTETVTKERLVAATKDGSRARTRFHHGLIAQEVKTAADAQGVDFAGYQDHSIAGGTDVLSVGYSELIAPLIKAVQELSAENAALNQRLSDAGIA